MACGGILSLAVAGSLFWMTEGMAAAVKQVVPPGYQQIARVHGVPAEVLYALALAESAKRLPQEKHERPWPWTLNVAGKSYRYATRQAVWQALQGFMRSVPLKRIDVGITQVNLGWNGHYFRSYWDALDPYTNLHVAARILKTCYQSNLGSWLNAAGCYHHPAGGQPASKYRKIVARKLSTLETRYPVLSTNIAVANTTQTWIEPKEK
ncbi:transglycosylase family protein [Photorhabdus aegyptia]|uniref:Transglycosylase family protein n=2 Tax=Photorhabdus aegyptia TaxID=2805098 RepID=A0A022PFW3_9GAMM|nr:transglycosylase family protein [Photorhabdus aegyptia]